ncbi:MAG TPA: transposase [Syntrophorhabdus sp.]|nr:transposase [Syntrophorhabdus sp.]
MGISCTTHPLEHDSRRLAYFRLHRAPPVWKTGRSKYVIHLWNRSGNVASWTNILAFFADSYGRIRSCIRVLGVIADSGFYLKQFIERLEEERLTYIIAVKLIRPLQRQIYTITQWKEVARGLSVSEFSFMHPLWGNKRRFYASPLGKQEAVYRYPAGHHEENKGNGEDIALFAHEIDIKDYRFSVWITNSHEPAYDVWTLCKPRANDENTIRELKEDFAFGGFSMKRFYAVEAAMVLPGPGV